MTALAGLLHLSGCRVTGSDRELYPPTSTILEGLGVEVYSGFSAEHLQPAPHLVVVGNAISRGNAEAEEVLDRRLPYTSMPRLISERFLAGRHSIVVAGTHGKTTTAAMLAWVLAKAGRDPGFLVGGAPLNFNLPFRLGRGEAFVIEGDEYDTAFFDKGPKFMHYRPDTVLLGTVEFDHADIFGDVEEIKTAFRRLVNLVPRRGLLVRHEESAIAVEVTSASHCRVEGFGIEAGRWRAEQIAAGRGGASFRVSRDGETFADIALQMDGAHNVRNALAVVAAAHDQGLSAGEIVDGLATFKGVRRRLELRGEPAGIKLFDDFAHHPTAIAETLRAVRNRHREARIWAIVEPRSWSMRRRVFQDRLAPALQAADEVVIAAVFGAEALPEAERLDPQLVIENLRRRGCSAHYLPHAASIIDHVALHAAPGDVIVVMSNGGFDGIHERLLDRLSSPATRGAEHKA
jgi:UDP-N-acetylmuramate: L-alanyl-gamma-D-glutamyl-meso-diaminopimelate ligase